MDSYINFYFTVYETCDINQCKNGGICVKLGGSYTCNCPSNYSGTLCQIISKKHIIIHEKLEFEKGSRDHNKK